MPEPPQLPPMAAEPLSVILTAYNAQAHLDDLLEKWTRHLDKLQRDYEILLVDDGSTDETAARAEAASGRYPRLRVFRHVAPAGVGAALRTGLAAAQYPLVCCCAGDPAYQPADLKELLGHIDACHVVAGFRVEQGNRPHRPPWWYRWLARWVFGVRVRDVGCAFRLFRREVFARIPVQSHGPFALAEVLAKANFLGCVLDEVAVSYRPQGGEAPPRVGEILRDARRVFNRPDFGPAVIGPPETTANGSEPRPLGSGEPAAAP